MAETLFYVLAALAVAAAIGVVAARSPLFSVLWLLGAFFCLASIFLLAGFQFLAATQLLVYAGAIMVLFLFVVMLLNLADESQYADVPRAPDAAARRRIGVAAASAGALLLIGVFTVGLRPVLGSGEATPAAFTPERGIDEVGAIAELLFSRYVLAFEASSLLLLATMIAVILLAKRQRRAAAVRGLGWPWQKDVQQ